MVAVIAGLFSAAACGDSRPAPGSSPLVDVPAHVESADDASVGADERALRSLGRVAYRVTGDTAAVHGGVLVGRITTPRDVAGDSAITPTHDLEVCKPFTASRLPSKDRGVGNAVVWLQGVTSGPPPDGPRRATLTLERCQLEPRVQRMTTGGTVQVTSGDAMMSSLRFVNVVDAAVRTTVTLNDAGQVVPTSDVAAAPGLVEVRDDRHPWVRAYIAVASHPFVAVTAADGVFRFGTVPPGAYTLVVWQEQLGVRTRAVRVTAGVETRVSLEY